MNTNLYKFGLSEPGGVSYYDYNNAYVVGETSVVDGHSRRMENSSAIADEQTTAVHTHQEGNSNSTSQATRVDCKCSISVGDEFLLNIKIN